MLSVDCVFTDIKAVSDKEAISILANKLYEKGKVRESFKNAVLEREKLFPTGLPTNGIGIAIPHTDTMHVKEACFGIAKLKNPVSFCKMGGSPDETVEVGLIIMMGIIDEAAQVPTIAKILEMFSNEEVVKKIMKAATPKELFGIFNEEINL